MTQGQRRSTIEAIAETNRLLEKEMKYLPHLRKMDQIAFYERHIVKLTGYLEADAMPDVFQKS